MNRITFAILTTCCGTLFAAATHATEIRNLSMASGKAIGGNYLSAPMTNPALLSSSTDESDDFGFLLAGISLAAEDRNEFADKIDQFQDDYDNLESVIDSALSSNNPAEFENEILTKKNNLVEQFSALNDDLLASVGLSMNYAFHTDAGSFAIFAHSHLDIALSGYIANSDITDLNSLTRFQTQSDLNNLENTLDNLDTSVGVIAANVLDIGFTYSNAYMDDKLNVGVNLKNQRVDIFNYQDTVSDFDEDDFDADEYKIEDSNFNLDIGLTYQMTSSWQIGLSARNLISQDYQAKEISITLDGTPTDINATYKVAPEVSVGAAYQNDVVTLAANIELTKQEKFESETSDLSDNSQYASIGLELDMLKWAQLRLGYKHDLEGNFDDKVTGGVGLSPFDVLHIDLGVQFADDTQAQAGLQLAFTF